MYRPYWIQYKYLKKKLKKISKSSRESQSIVISNVPDEVNFFKELTIEVKSCGRFFDSSEIFHRLRYQRVYDGYIKLKDCEYHDKLSWSRLLRSCINLYRDVLLLENFAIMNYCGISKILKKHDKLTGFETREAFMRRVVALQSFSKYLTLLELIKQSENLYEDIAKMDRYKKVILFAVLVHL